MINRIAAVLPFVVFLAIYGAAIGHGFISDDFGWILDSRVHGARDLAALFARSSGFYRPIVGLTFAADYALFDAHPLGYGLTNLALALRARGRPRPGLRDAQPHVDRQRAFNVALNDAFELVAGRRVRFWVEPPLQHAALAGLRPPCPSCVAQTVELHDGRVTDHRLCRQMEIATDEHR